MLKKEQFMGLQVGNTIEADPLFPGLSKERTVLQVTEIRKDEEGNNKLVQVAVHYFNTKVGDTVLAMSGGKLITQGGTVA